MELHYSEYYPYYGPVLRVYHEKNCPADNELLNYLFKKYIQVDTFPIIVKMKDDFHKESFPYYIWSENDSEDALVNIFKEYNNLYEDNRENSIEYSLKVDGKRPFIYSPPRIEDDEDNEDNEDEN